ncbi:ABC transporter substrate-binding protein [Nocardia stercoris]|uniref:Peptide-binding protein n=1 Tax=Nocardia stercoris TaxID=2483361 RepID=A0A3M2KYN3_9NOCA|nr:ABC transporter substrate-binding protein [Nocardia stercoris]RMI30599.1 peptide-binding protein [Nocardia stercoris]
MRRPRHGRRPVRIAALITASALAGGALSACASKNQVPSIGYAVDAVVSTYNGSSAVGGTSGVATIFGRVLPGFFYTGPDGQPVADTDFGTAKEVPGDVQTIQYRLNPEGSWSDGTPTTCDDLVLEWAARSGRFTGPAGQPLFDAASTLGYSDIERVECQPGSKDATVVFRPGRHYLNWRTLFGAGEIMPAHVAAQQAGVPNVVAAVQAADPGVLGKLSQFWNIGWILQPGPVDAAKFPASGPYRIESFSATDGLVLVKNDKWSGLAPRTPRIVVWPKNTDVVKAVADKAVEVVDIGAESVPGLKLDGFSVQQVAGRGAEQLILATMTGVFDNAAARRALAGCLPRQSLFDQLGHPGFEAKTGLGSGMLNSRILQPDSVYYPAATGIADQYHNGDAAAAKALSGETVRIGYRAPDDRRARAVKMIADACGQAGVTVVDAGAPDFTPDRLVAGTADAMLGGPGGVPGPAGSQTGGDAAAALRTGQGLNVGRYGNGRYDAITDQLAADDNSMNILNLVTESENLLWTEMPSIPLFSTPRTVAFGAGLENGIVNPTKAGAGWNMDRWVFRR